FWRSAYLANQLEDGIVVFVNHALFQRDDGIVSDMNLFRTDLGTALGDVAVADAELVFEERGPRDVVLGMHFQAGNTDEKSWAAEIFLLVMVAQHVADILAQEALDAFAEFLNAVNIFLIHLPVGAWLGREGRNLAIDAVVPGNVGDQIL